MPDGEDIFPLKSQFVNIQYLVNINRLFMKMQVNMLKKSLECVED